ncbi:MAG: hypothetical protein K5899_01850 [Bacteroidaceae bacterium]|nr:hypothetical protein [Bacteroidaceae bacterium]
MKKFFTLIACALVAGSAFAQDEYTDLGDVITNGSISYQRKAKTDLSLYPEAQLVNFVSGEWVTGEKTQGTSRVVVDPSDAAAWDEEGNGNNLLNYCIEVVSRDAPVDPETGETQNIDAWDSRFFVVLPFDLREGDKVKFSVDIKAEKPASGISTQGHANPDEYVTWGIFGTIDFTTEWVTITKDVEIGSYSNGLVKTFAFDLGSTKSANKFYFDNIKVEVQQKKLPDDYVDMTAIDWDNVNWINLVHNGNCAGPESTSLVCRESGKGDAFNRVEGAGKDFTTGAQVTSVNDAADPWSTQFFITVNHVFEAGEKVKIAFDYRSDDAATVPTQTHTTPGNYLGGGEGMVGQLSFTPEWQHYERVVNAVKGMSTLTFNLNEDKTLATNFYFDNVEMCIAEEALKEGDKAAVQKEAADIIAETVEDGVPTGISTFKAEKSSKAIYNIAGQQIKALQKGLNIVNGEKVYVK